MGKGNIRVLWMIAGLSLFGLGIGFRHIYMFIGGMFLMFYTAIGKFPDD